MQLKKIKNKEDLDFFRQVSSPITKEDDVKGISKEMLNILYTNNAIGVAGPMVGLQKRIIVIDLQEHGKKPIIMINPEIIEKSTETIKLEESSISLDNVKENVERANKIKLKYLDLDFSEKIIEAENLLSVCIQHELDYLDGKLFFDYTENKEKIIGDILKMKLKNVIEDIDILRKPCEKVEEINEEILSILDDMLETMYESRGIGLTANQVGISKRLIVVDLQKDDIKNPLFLINPEIIWKSEEKVCGEEGCLSVPDARAEVERFKEIKVKYLDREGKENIIEADGPLSICLQHEIDHSNGKLYIDYLSKLKRDVLLKKVKKSIKK